MKIYHIISVFLVVSASRLLRGMQFRLLENDDKGSLIVLISCIFIFRILEIHSVSDKLMHCMPKLGV